MSVVKITKSNFEESVLNSDKTVLLDFYADWCGPCKMLSPIVEEIAAEHPEIVVGKVNVDEDGELAMKFGVMSIPALFAVKDGEVINKTVGYSPKEEILAMLN
ncbi:MAG: thioredoxin [Ruminococcaceae bacterium]|nr:thioredoxin [Oscillospiraceae bacterium]